MIPSESAFLSENFEFEDQPTQTYRLNLQKSEIQGYTDELEAMKQAIYKILLTERFQYIIYSGNYGIETLDLYGQPISYVCPELERRIREALLWDERIQSVDDFEFETMQKGEIRVAFTAKTIFGDIKAERTVNF